MKCLGRDERTWAISTQDQCFFSCIFWEHSGCATGVTLYGTYCEGCVLVHESYCEYREIGCTDHIVRMCSLDARITVIVRKLGEL